MVERSAAVACEVDGGQHDRWETRTGTNRAQLSIIVVSYNTRELTAAAIRSVIAETRHVAYELIVVDNASDDGSPDEVRAALAECAHPTWFMASSSNLGFAVANNMAAHVACGKRLLLLNPDTVVLRGAIDRLWKFAESTPAAGIWGGRTLFADGSLNATCCWGEMTPWRAFCRAVGLTGLLAGSSLFNGEAYGGWRRDHVRAVDIVSGAFLMIDRDLWDRLDGFDASFFMYGEEADLCRRARSGGAQPMFTPLAEIIHLGGASEATREGKLERLLSAKATLARRHWPQAMRGLAGPLLAAWPLSRWLAHAAAARLFARERSRREAAVWRALWQRRAEWSGGYSARRPAVYQPGGNVSAAPRRTAQ
ncbi:MAG: glycosyltransferase [Rhizobiales bacterium]|nr:glycosyltransferase [Hyphomicrobiales bacterium]